MNTVLWLARDKDKSLLLYRYKPVRKEEWGMFLPKGKDRNYSDLEKGLFPEVTWENSPVKAKLVIGEK